MTKKIGIFGLGKSGTASAAYFRNKGFDVYVWDDSIESIKQLGVVNSIALDIEKWPWKQLSSVVLAPGVPLIRPQPHRVVELAEQHGVEVTCDIEMLFREAEQDAKFIGITGTNGKSTTTALVNHILQDCGVDCQMGGNIGIPALSLDISRASVFVLEVSSYQIDLLKNTGFTVATLLNITPDHIDRYGSMPAYTASKRAIFNNQTEDGLAVICVDQEVTKAVAEDVAKNEKVNLMTYITNGAILKGLEFENLPGEHNRQNIIAAFLICNCFVKDDAKIIAAIRSFKGLAHRMEKAACNENMQFINDSKATNAEATEPALRTFNDIYWMAGGVPKEGGIKLLEKYKDRIAHGFFYGTAGEEFARTYKGWGKDSCSVFEKFDEAFSAMAKMAEENGKTSKKQNIALLSPACASFDEFDNYEHRGKHFKQLAKEYLKEIP